MEEDGTMSEVEQLRAGIVAGRERLDAAVAGRDAATLEREPVCGIWTWRDVAGHLTDWNIELLATAEHAAGEPAPTDHPIEDGQAFNTTHSAARAGDTWATTKQSFDASVDRALALLERLSPEQLQAGIEYPWGGPGTVTELLRDFPGHWDEHLDGIAT
jgi:hypothetical protein